MSEQDKCIPWYLPPVDPHARLCSPFEARDFSNEMDKIQDDACQVVGPRYSIEPYDITQYSIRLKYEDWVAWYRVLSSRNLLCIHLLAENYILPLQQCLPDCEETHYTASVSAAPFRDCDLKNFGLSPLCTFGGSDGGQGDGAANVNPPIWGASVIEQYRGVAMWNLYKKL